MPACSHVPATRVVADAAALDTAVWPAEVTVLRLADDEVLALGTTEAPALPDEHAIAVADHGWVVAELDSDALERLVRHHIEWHVPKIRPWMGQGSIAGVPAKLVLPEGSDGALVVCAAALAHEFEERTA